MRRETKEKQNNSPREYKAFKFEIEQAGESGEFSGYAAVFGNVDSGGDIIIKGAFAKTITEDIGRIKILSQHNDGELPIGKPLELREDEKGLYIRGKISDTQKGRDIITLMKDGVLNELSIGYDAVDFDYEGSTDIRRLKEIRLWEVSVVTWAMNEQATIDEVKSINERILTEQLQKKAEEFKSGKISRRSINSHKAFIEVIRVLANIIDALGEPEPEPPPKTEIETEEPDGKKKALKNTAKQRKQSDVVFEIIPANRR